MASPSSAKPIKCGQRDARSISSNKGLCYLFFNYFIFSFCKPYKCTYLKVYGFLTMFSGNGFSYYGCDVKERIFIGVGFEINLLDPGTISSPLAACDFKARIKVSGWKGGSRRSFGFRGKVFPGSTRGLSKNPPLVENDWFLVLTGYKTLFVRKSRRQPYSEYLNAEEL